MTPTLASPWIFQFTGRHWQTINRKDQINGRMIARMAGDLPGEGKLVGQVVRLYLFIQAVRRFEGSQAKGLAVELEAVAQYVQ